MSNRLSAEPDRNRLLARWTVEGQDGHPSSISIYVHVEPTWLKNFRSGASFQSHQPMIIFVVLALAMLACALLAGFEMSIGSGRNWLHVVCFAGVLMIAFFVILDLEYPRIGLIGIDWMDQLLGNLRSGMG
jgi:hypothetical protein